MSRRLDVLAEVDAQTLLMQKLLEALRDGGVAAHMRVPLPSTYLRFQLTGDHGAMICQIDANAWASTHLPGLVGLDWTSMDPLVLSGLTAVDRPLQFAPGVPAYHQAQALPAETRTGSGIALPAVPAEEGEVWIESWTGPLPRATQAPRLPAAFALPVCLRLGTISLSMQRLKRLRGGDIVLLAAPVLRAWRGHCPLFDFQFQKEFPVVTHVHLPADSDLYAPESSPQPDEHLLDIRGLEDLPLELHVLLCRIDLSLGELAAMREGSVVNLPDKASESVQLLYNGRRIVTGELVQIGDRLGVKLAQVSRLT